LALPGVPGGVDVVLALVDIPEQDAVARVNGEELSTAAYKEELERALYSATAQYEVDWNEPRNRTILPSFQEQVLDRVVDRFLLRQLAKADGVTASPERIDAEYSDLQAQVRQDSNFSDWDDFLEKNHMTEEVVRGLIAETVMAQDLAEVHGGSNVVEQVHASHILVETEETGQEVLDKLASGEDFGELAAEYSTDPGSKDNGGDLGWFGKGRMVPEFEAASFSLAPGETSGLVETTFGFHIILVHDKEDRELDPAAFAEAQSREFQAWFAAQRDAADIERLYSFEDAEGTE
jgi:parvulin-like peptidyl-prolyl isomerase